MQRKGSEPSSRAPQQFSRNPPFSSHIDVTPLGSRPKTIPGHAIPLARSYVSNFLHRELSTDKLSSVYSYLWMCGLRGNIHALHWQRMMARVILVTENPALHLVWFRSTIYVKPLPRCLLHMSFWKEWICFDDGTRESELLWKEANGLIMTYTRLVVHESDFRIAQELGLLPQELTWMEWCFLREELLLSLSYPNFNRIITPRYHYGELRLFRLNFVYRVFRARPLGFLHQYRDYSTFFNARFTWLFTIFVYVTVALTAFQTTLATDTLPVGLQRAAYWLGVLVLIATAAVAMVQAVLFIVLVLFNLNWTLNRGK